MTLLLAILGIALSVAGLFGAAICLRVAWDLLRAGPSAAQEAYENGASLTKWWRGAYYNGGTNGSLIGRRSKRFGTVMEEINRPISRWSR